MELKKKTKGEIQKFKRHTELIWKEFGPEISAYALSTLWIVALNPGIGPTQIAEDLKIPKGTVSRNIFKLSKKKVQLRNGQSEMSGLGLIKMMQDDPYDTRKKRIYLTQKGHETIERLISMQYI